MPAGHLARAAHHVSDERIPPRTVRQTNGTHTCPIDEVLALSRQVIAEERQVDRIAVRIVAVRIMGQIAFEQHLMGAGHVRSVDANFHPGRIVKIERIVGVVVRDDTAGSRRSKHHILANIAKNIVFDQNFRRTGGEADSISGSARLGPRAGVNIGVANLNPERIVNCNALAKPLRHLDGFRP